MKASANTVKQNLPMAVVLTSLVVKSNEVLLDSCSVGATGLLL